MKVSIWGILLWWFVRIVKGIFQAQKWGQFSHKNKPEKGRSIYECLKKILATKVVFLYRLTWWICTNNNALRLRLNMT